jgi:hypothetical protein
MFINGVGFEVFTAVVMKTTLFMFINVHKPGFQVRLLEWVESLEYWQKTEIVGAGLIESI